MVWVMLIQSTLTKSIALIRRSGDQLENNTVLEGDGSHGGNDLIEWGQGKESSYSI